VENIRKIAELLRPYTRHLAALGMAIVLGVGVGLLTATAKPPVTDTVDRWPLPQWSPYKAGPKRAEVKKLAPWIQDASKKAEEEVVAVVGPLWRFIGTVQEGSVRRAVIELEQGKRLQRLAAGEDLPNGAVVRAVGAAELTYVENEIEKTLKLFGADKAASMPVPPPEAAPKRNTNKKK
jgi:hypothetical protein